jgi:hypothetical protein
MTLGVKAGVAWLILCAVMFTNGAIRALVLQPRLGEDLARQVASLTGVLFVLLASWLFVRAIPRATSRQLLYVGLGWCVATVPFESVLGFVTGLGWRALLAEYNILEGRLWSLIVLAVLLGPWGCGIVARRVLMTKPLPGAGSGA